MAETDAYAQAMEQKASLDKYIIKSEVETHSHPDIEVIPNPSGLIEFRPRYPNFTVADIPTSNLSKGKDGTESEEEFGMRANAEYAMHVQEVDQRIYEDVRVVKPEFVKLATSEPVMEVLVLVGELKNQKIMEKIVNENGEEELKETIVEKLPYFVRVTGENIPIFEQKNVDRQERHFMNLSGEAKRINSNIMDRCGFTKGRGMAGTAAIHEQHEKKTYVGTPTPEDKAEAAKKGFNL